MLENKSLPYISLEEFVYEFKNSVIGDMYKYVDKYYYSLGMEQMEDEEIEKCGKDLYNHLFNNC